MEKGKQIPITKQSFVKLTARLGNLKEKLALANKRIGESGGTNDWHDNFAFDQAHRDYDLMVEQVTELENKLRHAKIIEPNTSMDEIQIGHSVDLEINGETTTFTLLGPLDSNLTKNWISCESPAAKQLLGHSSGDKITFTNEGFSRDVLIKKFYPGNF